MKIAIGRVIFAIAALVAWQLASLVTFNVPGPLASLGGFLASDSGFDIWFTARAILVSMAFSVGLGLAVGVPLGLSAYWRETLEPAVLSVYGVPKIIFFPIVLAIFKIGFAANVASGVIHGVFPVIINVSAALKQLPPIYPRVARSVNATPWQMFVKVYLPAMLPPLATSIRQAFGLSMIGVVLAEIFASKYGLGHVIMHNYDLARFAVMAGTLAVLYVGAVAGSWLIWTCERWLARTH